MNDENTSKNDRKIIFLSVFLFPIPFSVIYLLYFLFPAGHFIVCLLKTKRLLIRDEMKCDSRREFTTFPATTRIGSDRAFFASYSLTLSNGTEFG